MKGLISGNTGSGMITSATGIETFCGVVVMHSIRDKSMGGVLNGLTLCCIKCFFIRAKIIRDGLKSLVIAD